MGFFSLIRDAAKKALSRTNTESPPITLEVQTFAFERSQLPFADGTTFTPVLHATFKWMEAPQPDQLAQVLYEHNSGHYVMVEHVMGANPRARTIGDREAAWFLRRYNVELPERLQRFCNVIELLKSDRPPRPLEHWAGQKRLRYVSEVDAHEADLLMMTNEVVRAGIELVQALRALGPSELPHQIPTIPEFVRALFAAYRVRPEQWWGARDCIPPATVDILSMRWPEGTKGIQDSLKQLREMTEIPLTVSTTNGYRLGDADWPNLEEQNLAQDALRALAPDIERLIVEARRGLRHFESGAALAELQDEGGPLKPPNAIEIMAYRMRLFSGETYENIAVALAPLIGRKVDPGTVYRWCQKATKWIEKGNVFPAIDPPRRSKARPMDPSEIDKGKRQDGRTQRQRQRPSE